MDLTTTIKEMNLAEADLFFSVINIRDSVDKLKENKDRGLLTSEKYLIEKIIKDLNSIIKD